MNFTLGIKSIQHKVHAFTDTIMNGPIMRIVQIDMNITVFTNLIKNIRLQRHGTTKQPPKLPSSVSGLMGLA